MSAIIDYRGKSPDKTTSGIPLVTAKIVKDGRIGDYDEFIAEEEYDAWMRRGMPETGDVLITTEAPLGEVAQVKDRQIALAQRIILLRGKKDILDNTFFKYQCLSDEFQMLLSGRASGTTVTGIRQSELRKVPVKLPPLPVQRQIAAILSAFDDKIELNRRMNRTLEQMARALFKSWFVDFDPVRAKMRGEAPEGMDAETAALFPDELVEIDGRDVPRGWRVGRIGDIAFQGKEQMNPNAFPDALFAHFSIPAFDSGQSPTLEPGSNIKSNKFIVPDGAILVSKLNPATPRIWNVDKPEGADFNVCSTEFIPLVPENSEVAALLYAALTGDAFRYTLADQASGTSNSHQRVKPADIINAPLILPDEEVLATFGSLSIPILEHMKYNIRESTQLAAIRDALLPRLLAGEIDVSEWEETQ